MQAVSPPLHNTSDTHYSHRELLAEASLIIPVSGLAGAIVELVKLSDLPLNSVGAHEANIERLRDLGLVCGGDKIGHWSAGIVLSAAESNPSSW